MSTRFVWEKATLAQKWEKESGYITMDFTNRYYYGGNDKDFFTGEDLNIPSGGKIYCACFESLTDEGILSGLKKHGSISRPVSGNESVETFSGNGYTVISQVPFRAGQEYKYPLEWFKSQKLVDGGTRWTEIKLKYLGTGGSNDGWDVLVRNFRNESAKFKDIKGPSSLGHTSGPSQGPYRGSLSPCNIPANISRRCVA